MGGGVGGGQGLLYETQIMINSGVFSVALRLREFGMVMPESHDRLVFTTNLKIPLAGFMLSPLIFQFSARTSHDWGLSDTGSNKFLDSIGTDLTHQGRVLSKVSSWSLQMNHFC